MQSKQWEFGEWGKCNVPTCAVQSEPLKNIILWTSYQHVLKQLNHQQILKQIVAADYLGNDKMYEQMMKNVFKTNFFKEIDEVSRLLEENRIISLLEEFKRKNEVEYFCKSSSEQIYY